MRLAFSAFRFQLALARRTPDLLHVLVTAPLFTVVFLAISEHAGRRDLAAYAVLAPCLMSLWAIALFIAGEVITQERHWGTLEALVATPARFSTLVTARITAVTLFGSLSFGEAWLVAAAGFGIVLPIEHPVLFLTCLLASALAMAGTASTLAAVFVVAPSARIVQNTLSYPFYLLAGVLVPVHLLPEWVQPLSKVIFLSWSSDLLRDTLSPAPVAAPAARLAVICLLGLAGHAAGALLMRRFLRRVREQGTLSQV
ncbi:ABC transporter permease [Crossiella cryophila]|uniref:ABC-2 type transport system permease protein n=1 Tax=Crossiella cryophila TaxID=43355 RepID=A0A7W7CCR0_9PSEU|nr:ABC transporter permease [Crossiella cryophila]MBB4678775.1 ABC-2 type transport system permease protein [Crossiella cryophila]